MNKISNVDTIYILADIENYDNVEILNRFREEKEIALLAATNNANNKHLITINEMVFQILPNGAQGYTYILRNNLYEVKIAQKRAKLEAFYPIQIRISSENLWANGLINAWTIIYNWIVETFGNIIRHKVSRIDLCCHISDIDLITDYNMTYKGKFKKKELFYAGKNPNAITFGSRKNKNIYCRIYNKSLEIQKTKSKSWFKEIWQQNNMNINNVWNIEFEVKSDILREFNLIEVNRVYNRLRDLWHYCTNEYLVKVDRVNTRIERCPVNKQWKEIQTAYEEFRSFGLIKREKQIDIEANTLIPTIIGYMTSYSAKKGEIDIKSAFNKIYIEGQKFLENKKTSFKKEVKDKMLLINKREVKNNG